MLNCGNCEANRGKNNMLLNLGAWASGICLSRLAGKLVNMRVFLPPPILLFRQIHLFAGAKNVGRAMDLFFWEGARRTSTYSYWPPNVDVDRCKVWVAASLHPSALRSWRCLSVPSGWFLPESRRLISSLVMHSPFLPRLRSSSSHFLR